MLDLKKLIKVTKNEYASVVADGTFNDIKMRYSTGSYILNALLSADIFGGFPNNRIISFNAPPASGKSYIAQSCAVQFLNSNPNNMVVYVDSEGTQDKDTLTSMGLDAKRTVLLPIQTIEDLQFQVLKILGMLKETPKAERDSILFIIDSLGHLSTNKNLADRNEGATTMDMTMQKLKKEFFRNVTLDLTLLQCPMIVVNHTYQSIGFISKQEIAGGSGMQYSSSANFVFQKSQGKEGDLRVGTIVTAKSEKNRFTREGTKVTILIRFNGGLDLYHGLAEHAINAGVLVKKDKKLYFSDTPTATFNAIDLARKPSDFWTMPRLNAVNEHIKTAFTYSNEDSENLIPDELDDDDGDAI